MKLGLFGGSFDPIHRGHVELAQAARAEAGLDRVLFLPTADPPHKPPRSAPAWSRFVMVELALLDQEGLFASAHEMTPGSRAYTVDTLDHFQESEPDAELHLLLGSDSLAQLYTWRRWQDLLRLARLVVLRRPGWDPQEVRRTVPSDLGELLEEDSQAARRARGGRLLPLWVGEPREVSSTAIRKTFEQDEPIPRGDLAPRVLDYIQKYGLYR